MPARSSGKSAQPSSAPSAPQLPSERRANDTFVEARGILKRNLLRRLALACPPRNGGSSGVLSRLRQFATGARCFSASSCDCGAVWRRPQCSRGGPLRAAWSLSALRSPGLSFRGSQPCVAALTCTAEVLTKRLFGNRCLARLSWQSLRKKTTPTPQRPSTHLRPQSPWNPAQVHDRRSPSPPWEPVGGRASASRFSASQSRNTTRAWSPPQLKHLSNFSSLHPTIGSSPQCDPVHDRRQVC